VDEYLNFNSSWKDKLDYDFSKIETFLKDENKNSSVVYPATNSIFNAFKYTSFEDIKVVILGQDPYHGENQAHGLAFSVQDGVTIPPSLRNIYHELKDDLNINPPSHGNLTHWAKSGVFLLNTVLTVRAKEAHSHQKIGWEDFTDEVIKKISKDRDSVVFILWGKPAQKKASLIDEKKHLIITSAHPSPLSSYRGFFGSRPFSRANDYLKEKNIVPVNWELV